MNRTTRITALAAALMLAIITALTAQPPAATAALASVNCESFGGSYAGAQSFFRGKGGPTADPYGLDGDNDGYPCERLAVGTPASGEPKCLSKVLKDDCRGRDMYRALFWLTGLVYPNDRSARGNAALVNQTVAVRGALLEIMAPTAALRADVADTLQLAYNGANYSNPACVSTVRTGLLDWTKQSVAAGDLLKAWVSVLGIGQEVITKILKAAYPGAVGTYSGKLLSSYLEQVKKVSKTAVGLVMADKQITALYLIATDSNCF